MNSAVAKTMPAKVTHLIATLMRGGAEKQLWCLSTALERRGWPQSVIAFSPGGVWEPRLREAGIPVCCLARHWFKPWRLWQLRRLLRPGETANPHVLVAGHRGLCALGLPAAADRCGSSASAAT